MKTSEVVSKVDIWLIVGARRWARIMANELCAILPVGTAIHLQVRTVDVELGDWWNTTPFKERIQIVEQPLQCPRPLTGVALIVNSAYQHQLSIEKAFAAGYNVVSEKPMTFSRQESLYLVGLGEAMGLKLLSMNTYLFADYLHVFNRNWLQGKQISKIVITWADATKEVRHGEPKGYDSSVPVIIDVLPHVANIILATYGEIKPDLSEVIVRRGGSEVNIHYQCDQIRIFIQIARNADRRIRLAKFYSVGEETLIDFSTEPGSVTSKQAAPVSADPAWKSKRKPIAAMLNSVREYFETNTSDERLSPQAGVFGNDLIDRIIESYVQQQVNSLDSKDQMDVRLTAEDFAYAGKESRSIAKRALPFLSSHSPLRHLAIVGSAH
jgi:predicted dehydrogenase